MARLLPQEASKVNLVVGDIMRLAHNKTHTQMGQSVDEADASHASDATVACYRRHIAPKFHLVMCYGVLHHCAEPAAALRQLVESTLLPGGVLQLGTYSTLSVQAWRPHARRLLHRLAPDVVDADGEVARQPTLAELRAIDV